MGVKIDAAVYSSVDGRSNNEDSFYLNGLLLKNRRWTGVASREESPGMCGEVAQAVRRCVPASQ